MGNPGSATGRAHNWKMYSSRLQAESYSGCHWPDGTYNFLEFSDMCLTFIVKNTNYNFEPLSMKCETDISIYLLQRKVSLSTLQSKAAKRRQNKKSNKPPKKKKPKEVGFQRVRTLESF